MGDADGFDPKPADEEGYEAARRYLRRGFRAWAKANSSTFGADDIEHLVHLKWSALDRHLTCWRRSDLDEVLLELVPARVILEEDEADQLIPATAAYVSFLEQSGLLDPASEDPALLREHLGVLEPLLRQHLADPSRYSSGKRFWLEALSAGVSLEDEHAVAAFVEQFNARSRAERAAALGSLPTRPLGGRFNPPGTLPRQRQPTRKPRRRR